MPLKPSARIPSIYHRGHLPRNTTALRAMGSRTGTSACPGNAAIGRLGAWIRAPYLRISYRLPTGLRRTEPPEEDGGRVGAVGLREERREVGAVVDEVLVTADEVAAGERRVFRVERGFGQPVFAGVDAALRPVARPRVAMGGPVVRRQTRVRRVVAEVVVADRPQLGENAPAPDTWTSGPTT